MDLQTAFYTIGIIAMVLWIFIFVVILTVIYGVKREIEQFKSGFKEKVFSLVKDKNVKIASALGLSVAHFIFNRIVKKKNTS